MRRAAGFTLIELVLVMLIISGGLLGIASLFSNTSKGLSTNDDLQIATQAAQQCAERVLALRRGASSFTAGNVVTTMCDVLTVPTGFTRDPLSISSLTAGSSAPTPCLTGQTCSMVTVKVKKTSVPAIYALIEVMLAY